MAKQYKKNADQRLEVTSTVVQTETHNVAELDSKKTGLEEQRALLDAEIAEIDFLLGKAVELGVE